MNTKDEALELTQIDFGGDCDTPPEPWSAIWVAWNSEDGFSFWKHQNQASLWSATDSNQWPVQYAMQKAQPAPEQYTALEQALTRLQKRYAELEAKVAAQPVPVQEPVLWMGPTKIADLCDADDFVRNFSYEQGGVFQTPLYTAPPAANKPWVGLTDEEANAIIKTNWGEMKGGPLVLNQRYIRSIEAKLKEKNSKG